MKFDNKSIGLFNFSLLDVIFSAMGAFLILTTLLSSWLSVRTNEKTDIENQYGILRQQFDDSVVELNALKLQQQEFTSLQNSSFLLITASWDTSDADIDLYIRDPKDNLFYFESPQFQNSFGKLVKDTRRGPGAEIWFTPVISEGDYQVRVIRYISNTNQEIPISITIDYGNETSEIDVTLDPKNLTCMNVATVSFGANDQSSISKTLSPCSSEPADPKPPI